MTRAQRLQKGREVLARFLELNNTKKQFGQNTCGIISTLDPERLWSYQAFLMNKGYNAVTTLWSNQSPAGVNAQGFPVHTAEQREYVKNLRISLIKEFYGLDKEEERKRRDHNFRAWCWRGILAGTLLIWYGIYKLFA